MFGFTIRYSLSLLLVMIFLGPVASQEADATLKQLLARGEVDEELGSMMRYHMSYHTSPKRAGQNYVLAISWFYERARTVLRYTVTEGGEHFNVRYVHNHASQASHSENLSEQKLQLLRSALLTLPQSKADPPIKRTVHVSFRAGDEWRTETYDADALPSEFELVMKIIGERFETIERHEKK